MGIMAGYMVGIGKVENSIYCGSAGYASGLADLYGDRA